MGIEDLVNQGKEFLENNKDTVEDISDKLIDGASGIAKNIVSEEHHGTVDDIARHIDGAIGNE